MPLVAFASTLPDTGQTKCYDYFNEIPCPNPGELYYGQDSQYTTNPQSYTKLDVNGDDLPDNAPWPWAMVRDNVTGLIWEVKQDRRDTVKNYENPHDADNIYYWSESLGDGTGTEDCINALKEEEFGGRSDWRLPTVKEWLTIIDSSIPGSGPNVNTDYFADIENHHYYWSSTTEASFPSNARIVHFSGTSPTHTEPKHIHFYVRAVSGVQFSNNFVDNADWTISDKSTGLMWEVKTDDGGPRDNDNYYNWGWALAYCENLTLAGYNDWRLPNWKELLSIVDYNRYEPSIDPIFANTLSATYRSSTNTTTPNWTWHVSFTHGHVSSSSKNLPPNGGAIRVRAVRGGLCGLNGDLDSDTVCNNVDDCPFDYNPSQEDTDGDCIGNACDEFPNNYDITQLDFDSDGRGDACDNCPNHSNPLQEDTSPPQGNNIGDACDCEGNFDCDGDCDGTDAAIFKANFGRSTFDDPCEFGNPCNGDFDCDSDCDGTDAFSFKLDYGRSEFNNPYPACDEQVWCSYPLP